MEKIIALLILSVVFTSEISQAKPKRVQPAKVDKTSLAKFVSSFELSKKQDGSLKMEIQNANGQTKDVELQKVEEYTEFTRYSLSNPFAAPSENHTLNLYIFEKVKPTVQESREALSAESETSELRMDLVVLLDSVTKKALKTKGALFYKDNLVAEGSIDNNSQIKIIDDLSGKIKSYKLQELKVTKNLLGSDKRSLDFEVKIVQAGQQIKQKLNINLLNMKLTPKPRDEDILDEELDFEGEDNETNNSNS